MLSLLRAPQLGLRLRLLGPTAQDELDGSSLLADISGEEEKNFIRHNMKASQVSRFSAISARFTREPVEITLHVGYVLGRSQAALSNKMHY